MQQRMARDIIAEIRHLILVRQFAEHKKIADFQEIGILRQLLDRVTPVAQDAFLAVEIGNRAVG